MPRAAADKLIFEKEAKVKAERDAKLAKEKADKEKEKKGKVFAHLSSAGARTPSQPPLPKQGETGAAEERLVPLTLGGITLSRFPRWMSLLH